MRLWAMHFAVPGLVVAAAVLGSTAAQAAPSYKEGSSGCSLAHCSNTLQGETNTPVSTTIPHSYTPTPAYSSSAGSSVGLGCASNGTYVACSFTGSGPNVRIYKSATSGTPSLVGTSCYNNGGHTCLTSGDNLNGASDTFDTNAYQSAPIVMSDGGVIAADDQTLGYWNPTVNASIGSSWVTSGTKPLVQVGTSTATDTGSPISPVLVDSNATNNTGIVFVAEKCASGSTACGVETYVISYNGFVSAIAPGNTYYTQMKDSAGNVYAARNTPSIDQTHIPARAYVVASQVCTSGCGVNDPAHGAIFVTDIDNNPAHIGTTYGQIVHGPTDIYDFPGPSGSSPLLIPNMTVSISGSNVTGNGLYFDGLSYYGVSGSPNCTPASYSNQSGARSAGCFYGILDTSAGSTPAAINRSLVSAGGRVFFGNNYPGDGFQAAASLDPRGGIWVFPINSALSGSQANWTCGTGGHAYDNCLVRLNTQTGATLQGYIDLTSLLGIYDDGTPASLIPYAPGSATTVTSDSGGHVYLTMGAYTLESLRQTPPSQASPRATTIDVTTVGSETMKWVTPNAAFLQSAAFGQFPILKYVDSSSVTHYQTVFTTSNVGPFFYWQ